MAQNQPKLSYQLVKATTSATIGGGLLLLSGLTLAATVVGLTIVTPLLVIFSPVLVPAAITLFLILAGLLSATGLGVSSLYVFYWMYSYITGKRPFGAEKLDQARAKFAGTAMGIKESVQKAGH